MTGTQRALVLTPAITGHIAVIDGQATTTTQDIAEVYGRRHEYVLKIVRQRMTEAGEWRLPNFWETVAERPNPSGGAPIKSPVIRMTKKGFHFVVGKFTGVKAVQHQIAFADEFERMEAELSGQARIDPAALLLSGQSDPVPLLDSRHTPALSSAHRCTTAMRDCSPGVQADEPPQKSCGYFFVRSMALLYGRAVWGAARLAGPCTRYCNLHGSAHPIAVGKAVSTPLVQEVSHDPISRRARAQSVPVHL